MKLEDQVCSLELAKKLKGLGVKQKSLLYWDEAYCKAGKAQVKIVANEDYQPSTVLEYSAFTVAELGEMLPKDDFNYQTSRYTVLNSIPEKSEKWFITDYENTIPVQYAATEADARAKMLIYLLENKLIKLT